MFKRFNKPPFDDRRAFIKLVEEFLKREGKNDIPEYAIENAPVSTEELVRTIGVIFSDEFCGDVSVCGTSINLCFSSGDRFNVKVEKLKAGRVHRRSRA